MARPVTKKLRVQMEPPPPAAVDVEADDAAIAQTWSEIIGHEPVFQPAFVDSVCVQQYANVDALMAEWADSKDEAAVTAVNSLHAKYGLLKNIATLLWVWIDYKHHNVTCTCSESGFHMLKIPNHV